MAGFWDSELGEVTGTAADAFAKSFTRIPDGTMAIARIDSFFNDEYNGLKFLKINWVLTDGEFKGSKVEQKLKVWGDMRDKEPAKGRHRALNMLKLIYQLYNLKPKHAGDPTDEDLSIFVGKSAGIQIRETEPNDQGKQYNWVSEIHDAKGFKCETGTTLVVSHINNHSGQGPMDSAFNRQTNATVGASMVDDIPF